MVNEEAEKFKQLGNEAFKEKKWEEAIKQYNKAISLDATNAAYYSNRSAAWASKGSHESALADANRCLENDANFVKGYARKGKALFDLKRVDEAEAAYKQGLAIDAQNDACARGLQDITAAKSRPPPSSGTSGGSAGGLGGLGGLLGGGGLLQNIVGRFKKGGRLQTYMMIMLAYYAFNSITGRRGSSSTDSSGPSDDADDVGGDADLGQETSGVLQDSLRHFVEADGTWISYLHMGSASDTKSLLLLLHSTSRSAEVEYGTTLSRLSQAGAGGGLRLLAPDRPCHGMSPCPPGGESGKQGWLSRLLATQSPPKTLALVAVGKDAAGLALALAQKRREVAYVWLLDPHASAPVRPAGASAADLQTWLQSGVATTAQEAADAARWAATSKDGELQSWSTVLQKAKLSRSCKFTLLSGEDDAADEALSKALEAAGAESVEIRSGASMDTLVEEVRQTFGDEGSTAEED